VADTEVTHAVSFAAEVGQASAPNEIIELHSVFTTDALSRLP
jgi:hypothetical protein